MKLYPNSTPEFRILKTKDGFTIMQVRYLCESQGYTSKWQNIPIVEEIKNEQS